ncbi:MAG: hypothetical protein U0R26_08395 [Solirubrobacterales bacterium]
MASSSTTTAPAASARRNRRPSAASPPGQLQPERHRAGDRRGEEVLQRRRPHSTPGPNSEHAGFCAWGRDQEVDAMRNMLQIYAENGVALLLSDTYDHEHAVKNIIGGELKEEVENFPGLVGVRPDSGDVVQVTSDTTEWLMDAFGFKTSSKGYKILPDYVRVVQGDGVRRDTLLGSSSRWSAAAWPPTTPSSAWAAASCSTATATRWSSG